MFALIALILFVIDAFGVHSLGPVATLPLGLAFVALHLVTGWAPWGSVRLTRN
jgi:hypothetical protein